MYRRLSQPQLLCPVCQQTQEELFPVASCPHRFCKSCAISYISSQANNFSAAKCLQEGCGTTLDKSLPVYDFLTPQIKLKLKQFESFIFLQQHPNFTSCKATDCTGLFEARKGKCDTCGAFHCKKCSKLLHDGPCLPNEEEREMMRMNFRKCPNCRIWVEKLQGCRFISCKCGTEFCFTCGYQFSKDPCRKRQLWENQQDIRQLAKKIQWRGPFTIKTALSYLFKSLLCLFVLILLSILFTTCIVLAMSLGMVLSLFVPLAFCKEITKSVFPNHQYCGCIIMVIVYPILVGGVIVFWLSIIALYPFCRNCRHHGIYDPFDTGLSYMAIIFFNILGAIMK